ncbi:MAG: hypothetical protein HN849_18285 [Victivallales bacterium]|nr:hypothetical protein [Victivallales bacterium]
MTDTMRDFRNIVTGREIPSENYSDQPYVVKTDDGAWLCAMTTGTGHEGKAGQHVVAMRSSDHGRTWSEPIDVEPADGPVAAYAVLLKTPTGRIYCFYNHNTDEIPTGVRDMPRQPAYNLRRVDMLGHFVLKFSDDHGRTWSAERTEIPIRETAIDRENVSGGTIRFFWTVGRPFAHHGVAYVPVHKIGGVGPEIINASEGVVLCSDNLLTETDPARIHWDTRPDGDAGLRPPPDGGPIAEEQSYSVLSDGTFYVVYRSVAGHPVCAYSRDHGHTWTEPRYARYANGRLMKHPRAANFAWRCANGKFLYWFHNHGGRDFHDRNPAWLCSGRETDSPTGRIIEWSQPEILLYDDDPRIRLSYPDLIEEDGRFFITETQKDMARVHELDPQLIEGLWGQFEDDRLAEHGLILNLPHPNEAMPPAVEAPPLPDFSATDRSQSDGRTRDLRAGFSIDLTIRLDSLAPGQIVLDNRIENGCGCALRTTDQHTLEILLNDGRTQSTWDCDPGMLNVARKQHITIIVDGGPKIITFLVDGVLNDGGETRQFGWGRFSPHLRGVTGADRLRIGQQITALRLYNRPLRTSEAIGNWRHTRPR